MTGHKNPRYLSLNRKRRSLLASPWNHPSLALQASINGGLFPFSNRNTGIRNFKERKQGDARTFELASRIQTAVNHNLLSGDVPGGFGREKEGDFSDVLRRAKFCRLESALDGRQQLFDMFW